MFSKANKAKTTGTTAPAPTAKKRVPPSIISSDLTIEGNLISDGEVQVDGKIKGDIHTRNLLVGEVALIQGHIVAESIRVHGKIEGQIKALNVSLAKTAHVVGDILHDNLSIETGAFLEGHCKRLATGEFEKSSSMDLAMTVDNNSPQKNTPQPTNKKVSA